MIYKDYALTNYPYLNTNSSSYELHKVSGTLGVQESELFRIPDTLYTNGIRQEDLRQLLLINRVEIRAGSVKILFFDADKKLLDTPKEITVSGKTYSIPRSEILIARFENINQKPNKIYYRENISFTMREFVEISIFDESINRVITTTRDAKYFQIVATYDAQEGVAAAAFTVFSLNPGAACKDKSFLKMLDDYPFKEQHIRLILLGENGNIHYQPKHVSAIAEDFELVSGLVTIEGMVQSGSINVNGSSAIRRTGSLQMIPDENTRNILSKDNLININTQFALEIGFTNPLPFYKGNPIIWLPQGVFVTTQCSLKEDLRQIILSLNFKDKSAFLNGELGGILPAPFELNMKDVVNEAGEIEQKPILIKEIAEGLLKAYSSFEDSEISIEIPSKALAALRWNASNEAYLVEITHGDETQAAMFLDITAADEQKTAWGSNATLRVIQQGDSIGWQYTDFVYYDKSITAQAGDNIIALLNKLTSLFVNYEFFVDTYGVFHFKEKEGSLLDNSTMNYSYKFNESNGLVTVYNNAPQYLNVKNDFILWGEQEVSNGYKNAFMYHLAFDNPKRQKTQVPVSCVLEGGTHTNKKTLWKIEQWTKIPEGCNQIKISTDEAIDIYYDHVTVPTESNKIGDITLTPEGAKTLWIGLHNTAAPFTKTFTIKFYKGEEKLSTAKQISINTKWVTPQHLFEEIYLVGPEGNYYYQELEASLYRMVDLSLSDIQRKKAWDDLEAAPYNAPYWLDLIYDESLEYQMIYVRDIGRRTKIFNNNDVNCICEKPNIVPYYVNLAGDDSDDYDASAIQLNVPAAWKDAFALGGIQYGAREYVRSVMHDYINFNEAVSITTNPIYYLEPNEVVQIERESSSIYGDFTISSFNIPLDVKSQMTIQCKRNLEMIASATNK